MYKQDMALNNLQELMYHKTQSTNLLMGIAIGNLILFSSFR